MDDPAIGECTECAERFTYTLIHNGFNDSAYAYCDRCGATALLDGWQPDIPPEAGLRLHGRITANVEQFLAPCPCGGRYTAEAVPRCPHCGAALDAEAVRAFIEANAPGAAVGWRWQGSWSGLYAIVIDRRIVNDPWKHRRAGAAPEA